MGLTNLDKLKLSSDLTVGHNVAVAGDVVVTGSLTTGSVSSIDKAEESLTQYSSAGQTTGTGKQFWLVGVAGTIVDIRAYITTAPVGSSFILDFNKNGTTLFTTQGNRPTIADGGNASTTTAPDVVAVSAGDRLSYDIDQIGSGTAGTGLMVCVTIKRALV